MNRNIAYLQEMIKKNKTNRPDLKNVYEYGNEAVFKEKVEYVIPNIIFGPNGYLFDSLELAEMLVDKEGKGISRTKIDASLEGTNKVIITQPECKSVDNIKNVFILELPTDTLIEKIKNIGDMVKIGKFHGYYYGNPFIDERGYSYVPDDRVDQAAKINLTKMTSEYFKMPECNEKEGSLLRKKLNDFAVKYAVFEIQVNEPKLAYCALLVDKVAGICILPNKRVDIRIPIYAIQSGLGGKKRFRKSRKSNKNKRKYSKRRR